MFQVMACRLFDNKPLPDPTLTYCELDPWEHISRIKMQMFSFKKILLKMSSIRLKPFCLSLKVLTSNRGLVEPVLVRAWINNYIPHKTMDVITHPCILSVNQCQ